MHQRKIILANSSKEIKIWDVKIEWGAIDFFKKHVKDMNIDCLVQDCMYKYR
jgi:hypothetical protein